MKKEQNQKMVESAIDHGMNVLKKELHGLRAKRGVVTESCGDENPGAEFGENWKCLDCSHYINAIVEEIVNDCQAEPDEDHKPDSLNVDGVWEVGSFGAPGECNYADGSPCVPHFIVKLYGGCNGNPDPRTVLTYLAVVRKFAKKMLDKFEDIWLVDWKNDCLDDVWSVRFGFKLKKEDEDNLREKEGAVAVQNAQATTPVPEAPVEVPVVAAIETIPLNESKGGDTEWVSMDNLIGEKDDMDYKNRKVGVLNLTEDEQVKLVEAVHHALEVYEERYNDEDAIIANAVADTLEHLEWITGTPVAAADPGVLKVSWTKGSDDEFAPADRFEKTVYDFVTDEYYKGSANESSPVKEESDDGAAFWKAVDDADGLDDDWEEGHPKFKVGDLVSWRDPEYPDELSKGWRVVVAPEDDGVYDPDAIYVIVNDETGSEAEVLEDELVPADVVAEGGLENELKKGDDGWKEIGEPVPVKEAIVEVDANTIWDVLELLNSPESKKNLTDLINSHVRSEEEIMDAVENVLGNYGYSYGVPRDALNGMFSADNIGDVMGELGLDVDAFVDRGEFVDAEKPVTLEDGNETVTDNPEQVKDDPKKYKDDAGKTQELVTGSEKKVYSEMTIELDVEDPWKLLNLLWGQGKENFNELLHANLFSDDRIMDTLSQFEIVKLSTLNDFLMFEFESLLEALGCDVDAWNERGEISKG